MRLQSPDHLASFSETPDHLASFSETPDHLAVRPGRGGGHQEAARLGEDVDHVGGVEDRPQHQLPALPVGLAAAAHLTAGSHDCKEGGVSWGREGNNPLKTNSILDWSQRNIQRYIIGPRDIYKRTTVIPENRHRGQ